MSFFNSFHRFDKNKAQRKRFRDKIDIENKVEHCIVIFFMVNHVLQREQEEENFTYLG